MPSSLINEGGVPENTISAFMEYLDNVLVPETFRRTVLQWLDWNYKHYIPGRIDVHKPYMQNVIGKGVHFDYVFKSDARANRYIVVKLFNHLEERCQKEDWHAIDDAVSSVVPYYESTLILASIHRFSDYCWQITSKQDNVKLVQVQTLNRAGFNNSRERIQLKQARS